MLPINKAESRHLLVTFVWKLEGILFYVLDHTGTLLQIPDMHFKSDTIQRIFSEILRNYLIMCKKLFAEYIMLGNKGIMPGKQILVL